MSDYDLIVIGSGFAGASATLNFCETVAAQGRSPRVALLEVGKEGERSGASRWTMAWLRILRDNRLDPTWKDRVRETSKGLADQEYCLRLEEEVPATIDFIEKHGSELYHHTEEQIALEYETEKHIAWPVGGGLAMVNALIEHIERIDGAEIHYETEALHLSLSEEGRVNGVVVRGPDGLLRTMTSDAVVIASGGFEGNSEMLTAYLGENAVDLPTLVPGLRRNQGAGIRMAMEIGAGTAGQFDMFHGEAVDARTDRPDSVIWGHNYGIAVNRDGKRFFDEGEDYLFASFELLAYEIWKNQNQEAYFITDKTAMDRLRPGWVYETTDMEPEQADTIRELAVKMGHPDPDAVEATVEQFNKACGEGTFDPTILDGKRTIGIELPKSNWANPIVTAPFYGFPLTARITFTFGGLKTDTDARVLTAGGVPIPGLYAAGEIVGLFYHEYPPATSVLRSLTFGRIAGAHAAKTLSASAS